MTQVSSLHRTKSLRHLAKSYAFRVMLATVGVAFNTDAMAHVSEQGFVLLLPTGVYTAAGIAVVILTLVALAFLPHNSATVLFKPRLWSTKLTGRRVSVITSLAAFIALVALITLGWLGPRDPAKNLLPLTVWTLWWIGLVSLQGLVGNLWHWINPWHGIARLVGANDSFSDSPTRVSGEATNAWPALILLIGFYVLMLADIAPDDPERLAVVVGVYAVVALIGINRVGTRRWFRDFDFTAIVLRLYGYLAPLSHSPQDPKRAGMGVPGWALLQHPTPSTSLALFALVMLGCGSFDGINETFWWLGVIGVNPLDFQGRSTIVWQTISGMVAANVLLVVIFSVCVFLGQKMVDGKGQAPNASFHTLFCRLSLCLLPIAFAYHVSHFIASFLVNVQYSVNAINDPFDTGANLFGIGSRYVTTGFLNNHHTVELLWLTQAAMVVFGHVLSILLSHGVAVQLYREKSAAVRSQIPLAVFMVAYTFLGLWLLASPRGA